MRKRLLSILLASTMVIGMTATVQAEEKTLDVWVRSKFFPSVSDMAEAFTAKTGIQVNVTEPSNMSDDLALALSSGNTPDVVSIDCVFTPYYASIGAFHDITEKISALDYKDQFSGGILDLVSYEGKQYAMPFSPDLSVLVYNKDLFAANGLDPESPPKTWDELVEYAKACTNDDVYGYVFGGTNAGTMMFTFTPYIWANGGEISNPEGTESRLNMPESIEALQFFVDMIYEHKVIPEAISTYGWGEVETAFRSQKAAMAVLGSAMAVEIANDALDFDAGVALIPSPDGNTYSSFSGGDSMAILADTDMPEEAWQFIEYCLSEEAQVDVLASNNYLPARADLYDNEYYQHEVYDVLKNALQVGEATYSLKYNEALVPWLDGIQYALNGEKTAEEAFNDAAEEINNIYAE